MELNHQPQLEEFAVFPKHTGVWQGDWIRLDRNAQETMRFTGLLTQQIVNNQWIQTNHHEFPGGKKVTLDLAPVSIGSCKEAGNL